MLKAQQPTTISLYQSHWKSFATWCLEHNTHPSTATIQDAMNFFMERKNQITSGSMNNAKSAIHNVLQHIQPAIWTNLPPEVTEFFKGLRKGNPTKPKYLEFPDLAPCLDLIASWTNAHAPEPQLRAKAIFLTRYAIHGRSADASKILRDDMIFTAGKWTFLIQSTKENSQSNTTCVISELFDSDGKPHPLCPVHAVRLYISRFLTTGGNLELGTNTIGQWNLPLPFLFQSLTSHKKPSSLKAPTLSRIIKEEIFNLCGLEDADPDCVRGVSATKAIKKGVPPDIVMMIGRWRNPQVFKTHYMRTDIPTHTAALFD